VLHPFLIDVHCYSSYSMLWRRHLGIDMLFAAFPHSVYYNVHSCPLSGQESMFSQKFQIWYWFLMPTRISTPELQKSNIINI